MVKTKILVVSSDSKLVRFLKEEPVEDTYQLICTQCTGEELREVVYQESPDLVIADVMMPRLAGVEIALRLRQWSQVPIIMLSTWEARQDSVRRFDLSAENYLSEPLDVYEVITLVEYALRNNGTVPAMNVSKDMRRVVSPEYHYVDMDKRLKIECAWCGRDMGERDGYGVEGVTHSICEQCSAKLKGTRRTRPVVPNYKYRYLLEKHLLSN